MKISYKAGEPLNIEGDPNTTYRLALQDLGLQRITSITVTTDDSGKATASPPVGFMAGTAWKGSAEAVGVDQPRIQFVNEIEDDAFVMTDTPTEAPPTGRKAATQSTSTSATSGVGGRGTYTPSA